jgi:hypothetical protein
MIKIILCKNGQVRTYGLNPNVYLKKGLRKALNTNKNKFLRGFVNSL